MAEENHPPVVRLDAVKLQGDAPFTVEWIELVYDADGDELEVNMTDDYSGGYSYQVIPAGSGTDNGTTYSLYARHTWTYFAPGVHVVTMTASDGQHQVSDSVVVTITGIQAFHHTFIREFANVTTDCAQCSGGQVGTIAALGAEGCQGFLQGINASDCLWYELQPEWEGETWYTNSTRGVDVDAELRTDCKPGPNKSISMHINDGYESAVLPKGAGCAVLWTYRGAPATIEFRVT